MPDSLYRHPHRHLVASRIKQQNCGCTTDYVGEKVGVMFGEKVGDTVPKIEPIMHFTTIWRFADRTGKVNRFYFAKIY